MRTNFATVLSCCMCLLLSSPAIVQAQDVSKSVSSVQGIVKDDKNVGVPFANIQVVNKDNVTIKTIVTDENGNFSATGLPAGNYKLNVNAVGFAALAKTINYNGAQTITLQLQLSSNQDLNEVVVVGYGTQRKSDLTGAISQLSSSQFKEGMNVAPDVLLQGKVSGVRIVPSSGEPGAGMNVSIRGIGSIRSGSTPLFVVDGVPLSNENVSAASPDFGQGNAEAKNPLNFLNTSDIESITVLKDASASAIYGARGSNGVVLIKTKKGNKGDAVLKYDPYVGISSPIKKMKVLNASEYRSAIKDSTYNHGGNTDWQDVVYRTAITQNHGLSFSKYSGTGGYYASLSRMDQDGIVHNSSFKRTTARINAEEGFLDNQRLKVKMNLTASDINETGIPNGADAGSNGQIIIQTLMSNPTRSVFDKNGDYTNFNMNAHYNPMYLLNIYKDKTNTFRVLGNVEATLRLLPGLNYKFNYGVDKSTSERNTTIYPNITDLTPNGAYSQSNLKSLSTLLEHYLTYDNHFGKHTFDVLGGFSYQKFQFSGTNFQTKNIAKQGQGVDPEYNPGYAGLPNMPSGYAQKNELQSFYGRVNYNYDRKYFMTASLRADGSTRFGENNKYGYFPSFALGWAITEESFMKNLTAVNKLKLRASWGQTGNQEVPNKITQASYSQSSGAGYYLYDNLALVNGFYVNRTANPNLKWEVVEQYNLGLDFSLFEDKLYGTVEYFNKKTKDPILNIPSPPLSPTTTIWENVGAQIVNKGFEITLGTQIIKKKDFNWSVDVNGATLKNRVSHLPISEIYSGSVSGPGLSGVTANIYKNGYEAGAFYMLKYTGTDSKGIYQYQDKDGNGVINSNDRMIFKGALPKFTFGANSYMNYKNFDFSFSLLGQTGGNIVNNTALDLNINNLASDRNVLAKYAKSGASFNNAVQLSSLYLEKSDFIRLNNVRIGYSFNTTALHWIRGINLYVSAQNLLTISSYSGYDPLINTTKNVDGNQSLGIDYTTYPSAKTIMIGASIKF